MRYEESDAMETTQAARKIADEREAQFMNWLGCQQELESLIREHERITEARDRMEKKAAELRERLMVVLGERDAKPMTNAVPNRDWADR